MSKSALLKSSIAKKYWMALTGLFLCSFLVIHLLGNFQLLYQDGGEAFNAYAAFMTSNPIVKTLSYLLYASILFHAVDGIALLIQNKNARPKNYAYNKPSANSGWASRNMGLLGTIILIFIIAHMKNFWYQMHWGDIPVDDAGNNDLYAVVVKFFTDAGMGFTFTVLYVVSMLALAFHLAHGFQSAFQSLGIRHKRYTPLIKGFGLIFSILIPLGFAIIPVVIYLR